MTEFRGVKLEDIDHIATGGKWWSEGLLTVKYFIKLKDGTEEEVEFEGTSEEVDKFRAELKKVKSKIADLNNIPEQYTVKNTVYVKINGNSVPFGKYCLNRTDERVILTNKEVDKFDKQFKMIYPKFTELSYCQCFSIDNGKASKPLPQRYIDNLEYMGYDLSCLEYELEK